MSQTQVSLLKRPADLESCWNDAERMGFLFSAFPETAQLNPDHWNDKMEFWTRMISALCTWSTSVCVDFKTVESWVEWGGRKPLGLQLVWDKMVKEGKIVSTSEYLGDLARNSSWLGWGVNTFVRKPTLWAAGKVLSPLKTLSPVRANVDKKPHICVEAFEEKCSRLLQLLRSPRCPARASVISFPDCCELARDIVAERKETEMLLLALEKQKKIVIFQQGSSSDSEKFLKFAISPDRVVDPANDFDIGVVRLLAAEKQLHEQVSALYSQHHSSLDAARSFLGKGEKILAVNSLRQKRRALQGIAKKESCLDNIQQLLSRLEQCSTDRAVLDAYQAGVRAYRSSAVNIDDVDAAMDDLTSVLREHEEVSNAMSTAADPGEVSTDDLEKELNELLIDDNDDLTSNQTDADIAKLVTSMAPTPTHSSPAPFVCPSPRTKPVRQAAT